MPFSATLCATGGTLVLVSACVTVVLNRTEVRGGVHNDDDDATTLPVVFPNAASTACW